jgi:hypothetical protein
MKKPKKDPIREGRIHNDAIADANLTFALRADFLLGRIIFGLPATRISEKGLKMAL